MRSYISTLFFLSIFLIIFGFATDKFSGETFMYINVPGLLFAMLKIIIVALVLLIAIGITLPALVIDLILLLFTAYYFPLVSFIWELSWNGITLGWFWTESGPSSILYGSILLAIISSLGFGRRKRE